MDAHDPLPFERFAAVRRIGAGANPPDRATFAYVAPTSGRNQLWSQPTGGGFATQLTELPGLRVVDFAWTREADRIVFLADHDGDEMHQVYVVDVHGGRAGWPRRLTEAPEAQHQLGEPLPGGKILIASNDREPSEVDVQVLDLESGARRRLTEGGRFYAAGVSPDGSMAVAVDVHGNMNQDLHLIDLESGATRHLTPHDGEAKFWPGPWARDGSGFYLRTDLDREFLGLAFYDLTRDAWRLVHAPDRDVEGFEVAEDGRTTVTVENRDGAHRLRAYDLTENRPLPDPQLPFGVIDGLSLHPHERRVLLNLSTPAHAANLFELELEPKRSHEALEAREQSMLGGLDPERMPQPEPVRYPSFDREIPAWLYRPRGDGPFPVVLSIHGGPEAQEQPRYMYDGLYAYLVDRGVAVLAPNVRGSTGYGKSYQRLIHRDWGGGELRDIEAAADWLSEKDWVDPVRIGVFGGSFGGFATLSAVTRLPDRWAVAVDVVGPANLLTFVGSVPPHWQPMMAAWVGDADDPADRERLRERSPLTHVQNVRVPMLIFQGANDPRVVQAESDQMVDAMRARGLEVAYVVDEKSGHGPADRETALTWWKRTGTFLVEHLA
ncbi:MAG: prolyl oligopeptidase family serine peptidase [Trueperaceae bacterium]